MNTALLNWIDNEIERIRGRQDEFHSPYDNAFHAGYKRALIDVKRRL